MNITFPTAAALVLAAAFAGGAPSALAGGLSVAPGARIEGAGDWRRHEIVRTYRDESGCRLSVISYHRPDGDIYRRQVRDCRKD